MMSYPLPYRFLQKFQNRATEGNYGFLRYEMNRKRVRKYEEELTKKRLKE